MPNQKMEKIGRWEEKSKGEIGGDQAGLAAATRSGALNSAHQTGSHHSYDSQLSVIIHATDDVDAYAFARPPACSMAGPRTSFHHTIIKTERLVDMAVGGTGPIYQASLVESGPFNSVNQKRRYRRVPRQESTSILMLIRAGRDGRTIILQAELGGPTPSIVPSEGAGVRSSEFEIAWANSCTQNKVIWRQACASSSSPCHSFLSGHDVIYVAQKTC